MTSILDFAFQPKCGPDDHAYGPVDHIIMLYHYLNSLNTTPCAVSAGEHVTEFAKVVGGSGQHMKITGLVWWSLHDQTSYW
jgi:hypothetical protein